MSTPQPVPQAPERVLATLNIDGSRRWIRPKPSTGRFQRRRLAVACVLMVLFVAVPYLRMAGKPLVLLDLPRRQFTLFGTTFLPTEMQLFMLMFISLAIVVFLVTALLGRVWCGWACPQTVYMEFLFRPLERWIEGGWRASRKLDRTRGVSGRRFLKHVVFVLLAMILAHAFLAYFVGVDQLARWVRQSPFEHPGTFLIMLGTTALVFFDFAYFREQTCLVACPYGRLQSVLLDRNSLIVGYDARRGEPRARGVKTRPASSGDCIDCGMCVFTCPTGIDIRDGLQMECIHCTQCMDACDSVMVRIGKPPGLIRYSSRDALEKGVRRVLRARVVLYPLALAVALGLLVFQLSHRADAEVTVLRGTDTPYDLERDGTVMNQVRLRVANRGATDRRYRIAVVGVPEARLIAPFNPLPVAAGKLQTTTVFVAAPVSAFRGGVRPVTIHVDDGARFSADVPFRLVGPREEDEEAHEGHEEDSR
jgi:cytochrome c oxidase accessory protein FixG